MDTSNAAAARMKKLFGLKRAHTTSIHPSTMILVESTSRQQQQQRKKPS
ncbi:MAG: hypothetical protein M3298_00645 [Thermoproteota archaeon]|nr:hypothetical protein [Thermoproteota archaeon]